MANRVHWPRTQLKQAGLLTAPRSGIFAASAEGRAVLANPPNQIDNAFLHRFEAFRAFKARRSSSDEVVGDQDGSGDAECEPPARTRPFAPPRIHFKAT